MQLFNTGYHVKKNSKRNSTHYLLNFTSGTAKLFAIEYALLTTFDFALVITFDFTHYGHQ